MLALSQTDNFLALGDSSSLRSCGLVLCFRPFEPFVSGLDPPLHALTVLVRASPLPQMHEESALGVARLRIRQLVAGRGRRGTLLRAALCLVRKGREIPMFLSISSPREGDLCNR